jgi:chemotaxis protein MotB
VTDNREPPIIIKKINKKGGGAHGGSWKVAYADFVTAMMAFFLLMWLLNMTSQQKKIQLSQYFQNFSLFEKGGGSAIGEHQNVPGQGLLETGKTTKKDKKEAPHDIPAAQLADQIKKEVNEKLSQYKDRILVFDDKGNVRIELIDNEGNSFFAVGGTELNASGKEIIQGLAPFLVGLNEKIIVEGHTDALAYSKSKGKQTNWELSTQRASTARMELERSGITPGKIEMVAGYAETTPLIKDKTSDPMNRRISIVVDYKGIAAASPSVPNTIIKPTMQPEKF